MISKPRPVVVRLLVSIVNLLGGDRLCMRSWIGEETDLCGWGVGAIRGTLELRGGGPGGGGGMLPRLCESPLMALGGMGPRGTELSLGGGPGGGGGIRESESPRIDPGACCCWRCSCGDSELDRRPIPMPIRKAALLALWFRRPGEATIGDVSRLVGGGPGGGGGIVCTFGRRVGVLRE